MANANGWVKKREIQHDAHNRKAGQSAFKKTNSHQKSRRRSNWYTKEQVRRREEYQYDVSTQRSNNKGSVQNVARANWDSGADIAVRLVPLTTRIVRPTLGQDARINWDYIRSHLGRALD